MPKLVIGWAWPEVVTGKVNNIGIMSNYGSLEIATEDRLGDVIQGEIAKMNHWQSKHRKSKRLHEMNLRRSVRNMWQFPRAMRIQDKKEMVVER
jgi:hypothetical protein